MGMDLTSDSGFQIGLGAPQFYDQHVGVFMAPFVQALVSATVTAGTSVLDVACGTGFATRAASSAAGPGARVDGCDINSAMLDQAKALPNRGPRAITWLEASALDLPYADAEFDAVICQQGLQFFPDPPAGIAEMARVARRGGRIGATVWTPTPGNPFLELETAMLSMHGGGALASFAATKGQLLGWFKEAGITGVEIEVVDSAVSLPAVREYVPLHLKALPWSASFFELSQEQQKAALGDLAAGLAKYESGSGLQVPFSSYLLTATI